MNDKYRVATPEEAAAFDASVAVRAVEHVAPALTTEPATPRAVNDTPPSAPPPAPSAVMVAPSNDAPTSPGLATTSAADLVNLEMRMQSHFAALMRENQEATAALLRGLVSALVTRQDAAPAAPEPVAPPAKPDPKRNENARIVKAERPWADPLIQDFIAAEMERVTFATASEVARAMFPGEFHDALRIWCDMTGKTAPDPRTTYAVLLEVAPARHVVRDGSEEKYKIGLARRRQMNLDLAAGDFGEVMASARRVWPAIKDDSTAANGLRLLLADKRLTKADLIDAIAGADLEQKRKRVLVEPARVFANIYSARAFARLARDLGGAK
jgi:hypothetical protein